jgi:hypothetical protein
MREEDVHLGLSLAMDSVKGPSSSSGEGDGDNEELVAPFAMLIRTLFSSDLISL